MGDFSNDGKKRRRKLIPKIVAYLGCSAGRTHFAWTNSFILKPKAEGPNLFCSLLKLRIYKLLLTSVPENTFDRFKLIALIMKLMKSPIWIMDLSPSE